MSDANKATSFPGAVRNPVALALVLAMASAGELGGVVVRRGERNNRLALQRVSVFDSFSLFPLCSSFFLRNFCSLVNSPIFAALEQDCRTT